MICAGTSVFDVLSTPGETNHMPSSCALPASEFRAIREVMAHPEIIPPLKVDKKTLNEGLIYFSRDAELIF